MVSGSAERSIAPWKLIDIAYTLIVRSTTRHTVQICKILIKIVLYIKELNVQKVSTSITLQFCVIIIYNAVVVNVFYCADNNKEII
jgi:hypothetical protein